MDGMDIWIVHSSNHENATVLYNSAYQEKHGSYESFILVIELQCSP